RPQVYGTRQRLAAHVNLEDVLTSGAVWQRHRHLTVKTSGAEQRRVEHVGAVGRRHDDHALVLVEAVHFGKHLVQGLLALVIAAAKSRATMPPYRVNLVNEDNRG